MLILDLYEWNELLLRDSLNVLLWHALARHLLHGVTRGGALHA